MDWLNLQRRMLSRAHWCRLAAGCLNVADGRAGGILVTPVGRTFSGSALVAEDRFDVFVSVVAAPTGAALEVIASSTLWIRMLALTCACVTAILPDLTTIDIPAL